MITDYCVSEIKKLSAESLVSIGALRRVYGKDDEFVCPFCGNGGNGTKNPTGIKPKDYYSHIGWKCHRCGEKFDNISILAAHYGLHSRNDFEEICRKACEDFGITFEKEKYNMKRGDYSMNSQQRKATTPYSGDIKLIYSSKDKLSEPKPITNKITHSERGIILEQLATDETALENFVNQCGGAWRGLPLELLKKHGCRFIKNWLAPSLLAKRPDAQKWATTSPRVLIPASTNSIDANFLARLTVPIENFSNNQRKYVHEKEHAGTKTLFNADALIADLVIAAEGYIDAMSLELAGFNAVALGSAEGYRLLVKAIATLKTKPQVLILLDPDDAGREQAPILKRALDKIDCPAVVRFLSEKNSKLDANQILVEQGLDTLRQTINNIIDDAQKEFSAFEKEVALPSPMNDDQIRLTSDQCKILFEDGNNALANARRLEYLFGDRLRYLQDCDRWLTYSNGLWSKAPKSQNACLYPFVVKAAEILKANATNNEEEKIADVFKKKTIRDSFAFLKGLESVIIKQADLDNHPQLLNCLNGVIDLETGILMQAEPKLLITQQCNAAYRQGYQSDTVNNFLRDILPDEETRAALIRWLAYCLTGEVSEEKAFLFYGSGGNGKGTATLLLMNLFADYATSLPITAICEAGRMSDAGAATTELNQLEKRRLAIVEELPQGRRLDTAKFKLLTGGDKIPIRRLHEEYTMINPTHKIIISGNYRPELTDARDDGLIRRIQSIDFLQKFTGDNRDEHLKKKLLAPDALSGLLTLLVADAKEWYQHGLIYSSAIENSTRNYFEQNDFLSAFISEFCEYGNGRFIELNTFVKRLKDEYPDETRPISDRHLKDMIKKIEKVNYKTRHGKNGRAALLGIGFKGGCQQQSFDNFQDEPTKSSNPLPFDPDDIPFE